MRNRLKVIGSEIINVKKADHNLRDFHLPNAILSYATFFRYFIADEVLEDRVLYLDSDIIVNANLDELFFWICKDTLSQLFKILIKMVG
ncbi:glycosyltransferase [Streptococcus pneumoniae]|nr:glycosyltransferase [Streptococcus pneumoniae]